MRICGPGTGARVRATGPAQRYAATKVHGEQLATIWSRETGGTVAALRFHNVYGPGMPRNTPYAGVASIFTDSLRRGEPPRVFEDGRQRRNFIHVTDVAAAVVAALHAPLASAADAAEHRDAVGNDSRRDGHRAQSNAGRTASDRDR